jgi:rhodanese-related sulfurtransferase
MRQIVQRALIILIGGAALGLAANLVSPRRIPLITPPKQAVPETEFIPLSDAYALWSGSTGFFLDARAPADYEAGHIPNAFSLPAEEFDTRYPKVASMLSTDSAIICYCDGVECDLSHRLADALKQRGFTNIRILKNAWTEWVKAGYPTAKGVQP